jgi:phosphoribosylformimino-5-aminoimidazole carboxamide ribotide isomerase
MQQGNNREVIRQFCTELPCQVGGGLRTAEAASEALDAGAKKVIIGSSLFIGEGVNITFAQELTNKLGPDRLIFAVDSRGGYVAVKGWKQSTGLRPSDAMRQLNPFCSGFLYTHIDTEGLMQGFPLAVLDELRQATTKKLIAAGGITTSEEVEHLDALGIDAVVGMAIYTGTMQV